MLLEQKSKLLTLSQDIFNISVDFRTAAENKAGLSDLEHRKQILDISRRYCFTIDDMYQFLKTEEQSFINNDITQENK